MSEQQRYVVDSLSGYQGGAYPSYRKPIVSWQVYDSFYNYRLLATFRLEQNAHAFAARLNREQAEWEEHTAALEIAEGMQP
jgi:hypothetical protein